MKTFFLRSSFLLVFAFNLLVFFPRLVLAQNSKSNIATGARKTIALLDYVSQDYDKAVVKGQVLNKEEYQEMLDFSEQTKSIFDTLALKVRIPNALTIHGELQNLSLLIKQKQAKEKVESIAQSAKKKILLLNLIELSPASWPSMEAGKKLFTANCQSCHGPTGAGHLQLHLHHVLLIF